MIGARLLLALALLAGGCTRGRASSGDGCTSGSALIEVRDGQGALELELRGVMQAPAKKATMAAVCDGSGAPLGTLRSEGRSVWLFDAGSGAERSIEPRPGGDAVMTASCPDCTPDWRKQPGAGTRAPARSLRLHDEGGLLRLLDEAGVPIGQIGEEGERALVYDPGGRGVATAGRIEPQDEGRLAVRAPDGRTLHIVLGLHRPRAAAAFALPSLPPREQLLLARFLDFR